MNLISQVEEAFSPHGLLPRAQSHFLPRSGQTQMATAIAQAIEQGSTLVVEAATGVGKTFSYLVPALLSGETVMVSTATKALQDQLFSKDLPRLVEALGVPVRTALLKGRASYLCLHRLDLARHDGQHADQTLRSLARIEQWSQITTAGDMAEMNGLDERSPLIPLVTSTRENCLGSDCPQAKACYVNKARREAMAADVVVINHHLFFADMAVRESGVAELLPTVKVAIFDEAHQLNEIGVQFLGVSLSTGQMLDFCQDLLATGLQLARGLADWHQVVSQIERAVRNLRLCVGQQSSGSRLRWVKTSPEGIDGHEWQRSIDSISQAFDAVADVLDTLSEISQDFVKLRERAHSLSDRLKDFQQVCETGHVRWVDVSKQLRLIESPLTIANAMKAKAFHVEKGTNRTWIFTSATLGDDEKLNWFTDSCGLDGASVLKIPSPFNYLKQAAVYIPPDFPKPGDPAHIATVAQSAARWVALLGGRTMVLTTTLRSLRAIGESLRESFADSESIEVLVQGTAPKRVLVDRFRRGSKDGDSGCVLIASASFWEGIDFPGEALQLVIIDKLPFPPPNDPLVEARAKALEAEGGNAFRDYFLPEAAIALKQGAGRLIRRETDEGILVICDSRLRSMSYGRRLLRALPAMRCLTSESDMTARLEDLTKICTTDSL
jgi:ATP-dependent DNA helicase DinG